MSDHVNWAAAAADSVIRQVRADEAAGIRAEGDPIVCASGVSPSGPIHLGNLREVLTTHFVSEELKHRGLPAVHVHSWDDYDRFRKVPVGVSEDYEQYLGMPLSAVPDPGGEYDSYGSRYIAQFTRAMDVLGVSCTWIRQSENYPAGRYRTHIRTALERRHEIFDILARFQTEKLQSVPLEERRANYWPLAVYCPETGKDTTTILDFDSATGVVTYRSEGVGERSFNLDADEVLPCKLVWKVDWPMRWMVERVVFEPGGSDHATPGSSYTVGQDLAPEIYGWRAPHFVQYAFVGAAGRTKMSSSKGDSFTPEFALRFIEPSILRWMYLRRAPGKAFSIDFGSEIWRMYEEYDSLFRRRGTEKARPNDAAEIYHTTQTAEDRIPSPQVRVSFRVLASAADMTNGSVDQITRIVVDHLEDVNDLETLPDRLQPRLDCALGWALHCLPEDERLTVRSEPSVEAWDDLDPDVQRAITLLADGLDTHWGLSKLTTLVYGVAKIVRGLPMDAKPDNELKRFQRQVFVGVYHLLLGSDTGPRLPTLILSLGAKRVRTLLRPVETTP